MSWITETPPHVTMTREALTPSTRRRMTTDLGLDANGCPLEEWDIDGYPLLVHVDDVPESDITTVHGMRCTSLVRTVIDLAPTLLPTQLDALLDDVRGRGLLADLADRVAQPDMLSRPGALVLRRHPALCR